MYVPVSLCLAFDTSFSALNYVSKWLVAIVKSRKYIFHAECWWYERELYIWHFLPAGVQKWVIRTSDLWKWYCFRRSMLSDCWALELILIVFTFPVFMAIVLAFCFGFIYYVALHFLFAWLFKLLTVSISFGIGCCYEGCLKWPIFTEIN